MKAWHVVLSVIGMLLAASSRATEMPKLTAYERSQGWRFLFDGQSLSDWRGYQMNQRPANWQVADTYLLGEEGKALVSTMVFKDFEIVFDWKVIAGGSAAVCFRAEDDTPEPADSGPVMQLAGGGVIMAGNGGLNQPWRQITLQPDVWYRAKILVFGNQVEHWINGDRVLSYMLDSADWRTAVAGSRYNAVRYYGLLREGRIVLTGRGVTFHGIKIRAL
ncbi:MAG: DUF1080 domain-containing protein [Opitutae bacterium]